MSEKTNVQSWRERVKKAETVADVDLLDKSLTRLWDAGTLSAREFHCMYSALVDKKLFLNSLGAA